MREWRGFTFLDAGEMANADAIAIDRYGIPAELLMENAGAAVASVGRRILGDSSKKKVAVLVGKGNNGGDGLVAARHMVSQGADVGVWLASAREEVRELPRVQLGIVEKMGMSINTPGSPLQKADLVVDGLLGYGAKGDPRGEVAELIGAANRSGVPILAVDVPSGLDASTGRVCSPCIRGSATVTFGYPKTGFLNPEAKAWVGELFLADISLLREKALESRSPFSRESIVRIW